MKKMDLVTLKKDIKYNGEILTNGMHGVVLEEKGDLIKTLFFNPKNVGDYLIVNIKITHLKLEETRIPNIYKEEVLSILNNIEKSQKNNFKKTNIKNYDKVELLVEKERYVKYGVHKGSVGVVVDDNAVKDYIEVDFSYIDEKGELCGESFAVKLEDIIVVE